MDQQKVFDQLKLIAGRWKGVNEELKPISIAYKLSASDTVLVEEWGFDSGMEALTLYGLALFGRTYQISVPGKYDICCNGVTQGGLDCRTIESLQKEAVFVARYVIR